MAAASCFETHQHEAERRGAQLVFVVTLAKVEAELAETCNECDPCAGDPDPSRYSPPFPRSPKAIQQSR
jgi:hypothetical protein